MINVISFLSLTFLFHSLHHSTMANQSLHQTQPLKQIAIDYTPEACTHCPISNTITLTYDHRGGARWRSTTRFLYGTFTAKIQTPKGNTDGLNFNFYLSSLEGDKSQDEIDFEFLGKDSTVVQTNYYSNGNGNNEKIHQLGFDSSDGFHEYGIKWGDGLIEWWIDGKLLRKEERKEGDMFPEKAMYLYASIWDASCIAEGEWTGKYCGADVPYVCHYKDIHVPLQNFVESMADQLLHQTQPLKQIAIDYTPEACTHCPISNTITLTYDHRGGARWRSTTRFLHGTFTAKIQTPKGNTDGLNFNFYLSSLEGDKSQDEIDFEFLGKDSTIVQTNYYSNGNGNNEKIHQLGFDSSDGFHEYVIKWGDGLIEWWIDGKLLRKEERKEGDMFPEKAMYLYASIWDASCIAEGEWTGKYCGADVPYVCLYKDIHVPLKNAVE